MTTLKWSIKMEMQSEDQTGLERLRASKRDLAESDAANGFEIGNDWARNLADIAELKRVAKLDTSQEITPDAVRFAINSDASYNYDNDPFDADPSSETANGFVIAAKSVLRQV
jgi:hypothetical protein